MAFVQLIKFTIIISDLSLSLSAISSLTSVGQSQPSLTNNLADISSSKVFPHTLWECYCCVITKTNDQFLSVLLILS